MTVMKRTTAGLVGGLSGGIIKFVIDQVLYTSGVSPVDTAGAYSRLFLGIDSSFNLLSWIIYIITAAIAGLLVSLIFKNQATFNYFSSGIFIGVFFWLIMNVVFLISGIVTPTWSLGSGGIISDVITHSILGISITYAIFKSNVAVSD
jgi:hypothetical protein